MLQFYRFLEHVISPIHVTAGRKRGDLRVYLQSPSGTRSTLLHNRPQDFSGRFTGRKLSIQLIPMFLSGSGFTNWPFMSVHSWGENPLGKWTLEIHNDAYTNWGSEAKFFRWSLKLYGTTFDPNSDSSDDVWPDESDENFVRPRVLPFDDGRNHTERDGTPPTTPETTTTVRMTTRRTSTTSSTTSWMSPTVSDMRGCVSNTVNCTNDVEQCRTFSHRKVAKIFCDCTPKLCLGISNFRNEYNLQCSISHSKLQKKNLSTSPKSPFYCQFIPFISYSKKRWRQKKLNVRKKLVPIYTTWLNEDWSWQKKLTIWLHNTMDDNSTKYKFISYRYRVTPCYCSSRTIVFSFKRNIIIYKQQTLSNISCYLARQGKFSLSNSKSFMAIIWI